MTYEQLYKGLATWAEARGYTPEHVAAISWQQVARRLKDPSITNRLWQRVRDAYCRAAREAQAETAFTTFRQAMQETANVIRDSFPAVEYEKGRRGEKRFITIWLDGRPEPTLTEEVIAGG